MHVSVAIPAMVHDLICPSLSRPTDARSGALALNLRIAKFSTWSDLPLMSPVPTAAIPVPSIDSSRGGCGNAGRMNLGGTLLEWALHRLKAMPPHFGRGSHVASTDQSCAAAFASGSV